MPPVGGRRSERDNFLFLPVPCRSLAAEMAARNDGKFVDYVLMAEFDIDKGSICRVQYPSQCGDGAVLAEYMLPEGAHNHFQDWTVFMLNRPNQKKEKRTVGDGALSTTWPVHAYRYGDGGGENSAEEAGWELMDENGSAHTLSLQLQEPPSGSSDASSGAQTLVIVLDLGGGKKMRVAHHDELQYSALQPDFASIYSIDGDAIGLHFRAPEQQEDFRAALDKAAASAAPAPPMLWCLNHVSNRRDSTVRRGAQVKALAICSRFRFIHMWKPMLLLGIDRMYSLSTGLGEYSEPPEQQCKQLYDALNALSIATLPTASELQREAQRLMLAQGSAQSELTHVAHVQWPPGSTSHIPLRVPLCQQAQEMADTSVSDLLHRFQAGVICLFHALLDRKRVLFLGHAQPAEVVCLAVLSSPLLVAPPLEDVLERCFPYTTLNNLDFLETEGFVAGSTNPIFESHPEWWDVLCDIDTGKVLVSGVGNNGRKCANEPARLSELDEELYELVSTGIEARYSEHWLRACFQEHAQQLLCERQRGTAALEMSQQPGQGEPPSVARVAQYLETLRSSKRVSDKEMVHILNAILTFALDESRLVKLLAMLPGSSPTGCLAPFAAALFHPDPAVRGLAASIMRAVEVHKVATPCVSGMNTFLLSGLT